MTRLLELDDRSPHDFLPTPGQTPIDAVSGGINIQLTELGLPPLTPEQAAEAIFTPQVSYDEVSTQYYLDLPDIGLSWSLEHTVVVCSEGMNNRNGCLRVSASADNLIFSVDCGQVIPGCRQQVRFIEPINIRKNVVNVMMGVIDGLAYEERGVSRIRGLGDDALHGEDAVPLFIITPDASGQQQISAHVLSVPHGHWDEIFDRRGRLIVPQQARTGEELDLEKRVAVTAQSEEERLTALRAQVIVRIEEQLRKLGFLKEKQHLAPDHIFRPGVVQKSDELAELGLSRLPMIVFSPPTYRGNGPIYIEEREGTLSLFVNQAIDHWHHGAISLPFPIRDYSGLAIGVHYQLAYRYCISTEGSTSGTIIRLLLGPQSGEQQNPQGVLLATVDEKQGDLSGLGVSAIKFSSLMLPEGWERVFGLDGSLIPEPRKPAVVVFDRAEQLHVPTAGENALITLMETEPEKAMAQIYDKFVLFPPYDGKADVIAGTRQALFSPKDFPARLLPKKEYFRLDLYHGSKARLAALLDQAGTLDPASIADCFYAGLKGQDEVKLVLEIELRNKQLQLTVRVEQYDAGKGKFQKLDFKTNRLETPQVAAYLLTQLKPQPVKAPEPLRRPRDDGYHQRTESTKPISVYEHGDVGTYGRPERREKVGDLPISIGSSTSSESAVIVQRGKNKETVYLSKHTRRKAINESRREKDKAKKKGRKEGGSKKGKRR